MIRVLSGVGMVLGAIALGESASQWLDRFNMDYIKRTYAAYWAADYELKEPCISAAYLMGYLEQSKMHEDYDFTTPKKRAQLMRSSLARLKQAGKIKATIGKDFNGNEARCWEPA